MGCVNPGSPTPQDSPDGVHPAPVTSGQPSVVRPTRLRFKPTRREKCLLLTLAVLGVSAAALWRPIQQRWLTWLVLRAEAPAQSLVDGLVARDPHPGTLLSRLWSTGKIPHRLAVLDYLQTHQGSGNALQAEGMAILSDAARGGDLEGKETAFAVLATRRHPEVRNLALAQLRDVDPAVRVVGLQELARAGDFQLVPVVMPLLSDPDPRVVAAAGLALGKWTSNDFGIRLSLALPEFKQETASADTVALSRGVARCREWWNTHQSDYPATRIELPSASLSWRLPTPDFALEDLAGNPVRLSSLQGKAVLLSFWDTTATNGFSFLSSLSEVQRRNSDRFAIIGISLDSTALERDHAHAHEHEHAHGGTPSAHVDLGQIRVQLQQFVRNNGITYPVLIDATGNIGHRFSAFELPTNVIIDREGNMRRRFVGLRSGAIIEAMLAEADEGSPRPQPETR